MLLAKRSKRASNVVRLPRSARVLVVEDDIDVREAIAQILEGAGYEVDRAVDARDALFLAAVRPPDLVTVDLHMPVLDGYELARRLKNEVRLMAPLLALTGKTPPVLPGPFDEMLFKPVENALLLDAVQRLLKGDRRK